MDSSTKKRVLNTIFALCRPNKNGKKLRELHEGYVDSHEGSNESFDRPYNKAIIDPR